MEEKTIRALVANAADQVVAAQFTEPQIEARAAAWQKAAPDADLAQTTTYLLNENRAFIEAVLTTVISDIIAKESPHDIR